MLFETKMRAAGWSGNFGEMLYQYTKRFDEDDGWGYMVCSNPHMVDILNRLYAMSESYAHSTVNHSNKLTKDEFFECVDEIIDWRI